MENPKLRFDTEGSLLYDRDHKIFNITGRIQNRDFSGQVDLSNDLTHYKTYTVDSTLSITIETTPIIGGSAEIRLVADGTHTPSFSADFTKSAGSDDYDTTLNAINKVVFYYDGTDVFYSITVLE